jgi:alcohol dehydrogenase
MLGLVYDTSLQLNSSVPVPIRPPGWALVRVTLAGICRTDQEILRGYASFQGIPGHEFVGRVNESDSPELCGQRVVGAINVGCGECPWCRQGTENHCARRQTLGIHDLNGAFAEYLVLPDRNLHVVPDDLSDLEAVFVEPLAAAFEILEQVPIAPQSNVLVLGDGKLGILCAWVLSTTGANVTLAGRHPDKLQRAAWNGITIVESGATSPARAIDTGAGPAYDLVVEAAASPAGDLVVDTAAKPAYDLVVEATGSAAGLASALDLVCPCGVIVLKSTFAKAQPLNLFPVVVKEITIVGSRCGPFSKAITGISRYRFPLERLHTARFPLAAFQEAFALAARRDTLKVTIAMSEISR